MHDVPASSLAATEFLDFGTDAVASFASKALPDAGGTPAQQAVALYYAVRDGIGYEVYGADLSRAGLRASEVARRRSGLCLHKSILYVACLRRAGIPSRLVLADVRNHLCSAKLRELIGGDVFRHHCLTSVFLNGKWVKATPVFSKTLCRLYRLRELDFDGTTDSLYHPFDMTGRRHMEFVRVHGEFDDVPYERIIGDLRTAHPRLFDGGTTTVAGSLRADAGATP